MLVPNPSYPIHIYGPVIAGADIRHVPITPDVDFFVELEQAIHTSFPKPKMLIINFPSNPTAQCVELPFFEKIVALARQYGIYVVHDLAYADIVFDGWKAPSIMQVDGARDVAVEFFTMSKSYNMAGWRVGFMVGNKDLVNALARIKGYHDYGTFTPIQVAAIAALDGPQECVAEIAMKYQRRRDVLVKGLHEAGWMVDNPKASMYVWARIPEPYRAQGSLEFAKQLIERAKVSVSPGIGFGEFGDAYVRFALIENSARTRQAVRGIKEMFREDGLARGCAGRLIAIASGIMLNRSASRRSSPTSATTSAGRCWRARSRWRRRATASSSSTSATSRRSASTRRTRSVTT